MADFLTRLVGRTLGMTPTVQPVLTPMFAMGANASAYESVGYEGVGVGVETRQAGRATGQEQAGRGKPQPLRVRIPETTLSYENPLHESSLASEEPGLPPTKSLEKPFEEVNITSMGTGQVQHTAVAGDGPNSGQPYLLQGIDPTAPVNVEGTRPSPASLSEEPSVASRGIGQSQRTGIVGAEADRDSPQGFSRSPIAPVRVEEIVLSPASLSEEPSVAPRGIGQNQRIGIVGKELDRDQPYELQGFSPTARVREMWTHIDQMGRNRPPTRTGAVGTRTGASPVPTVSHEASEPTIQVTIGRIEVRATPPAPTTAPAQRKKPAVMGLEEYLDQRAKGVR